jgi:hypothetical protein
MNEGRFVAELPRARASQEAIMRAIVSAGEPLMEDAHV